MQFRDLNRQYQELRLHIDTAIQEVVKSGAFIMGAPVRELEQELSVYVGMGHCVSCGNGTDAIVLALRAMGIGPGDAVFVPDFTFFASAESIAAVGATPVFVDVDPRTYNISLSSLESAFEQIRKKRKQRPRAIVTVDLFGLPADYPRISNFAQKNELLIIEDSAQGFGGSIDERKACSLGDICTTSFFPAKPLGCYGDGGAAFTNDSRWARLMDSYRVHGRGEQKYDNVRIGMNSRLDTIQAAILRVKFKALIENELDAVQRAADQYDAVLNRIVKTPFIPEGYRSSWAQYTIQLPNQKTRDGLQNQLRADGIPSMVYYPKPMHAQKAFEYLEYTPEDFPIATKLCETVLSLPIHPYITQDEIDKVTTVIRKFMGGA